MKMTGFMPVFLGALVALALKPMAYKLLGLNGTA